MAEPLPLATMAEPTTAPVVKARTKDLTGVEPAAPYVSYEALSAALLSDDSVAGPRDHGCVSMIVQRPCVNGRVVVDSVKLSPQTGMEGSGWVRRPERGTIDQLCVMGTSAIRAIAGEDEDRWPPAGDQLFLDMDLGKGNLAPGDRVAVGPQGETGEVLLEVTSKPHNGCPKFSRRYGIDALKAVNSPLGKERRLRGIYFSVVKGGMLRKGDVVVKVSREEEAEEAEEGRE